MQEDGVEVHVRGAAVHGRGGGGRGGVEFLGFRGFFRVFKSFPGGFFGKFLVFGVFGGFLEVFLGSFFYELKGGGEGGRGGRGGFKSLGSFRHASMFESMTIDDVMSLYLYVCVRFYRKIHKMWY